MSANGTWRGRRTASALCLALTALGALASCGHYGPPLRAPEYREEAKAAERQRRAEEEAQKPNDETLPAPTEGPPALGTGDLEGEEAP